jgi:pyruvate/2-oxoglutarate dehydrogenase complex dihydrolipoamide acyltransferase (E2) component
VYIDQARHEVGMLLNPGGGVYMEFECGGEAVEASGPFLSPVGPVNKEASSFTAMLRRSGATQTPGEYENALGERRTAIPMGTREANPTPATTGVELGFTIQTSAPLQIKAVTAGEIEAKQRQEEAASTAAAKKRQDEEAAAAAATKRRQEEESAAAAATKRRQEEEVKLERLRRTLLSGTLKQCRQADSKHKRVRCEKRAKQRYANTSSR